MAARDFFHEMVKQALVRDGCHITDDPLRIRYGGVDTYVDLAAEKLIAAEKADRKIAVEVKSFWVTQPSMSFIWRSDSMLIIVSSLLKHNLTAISIWPFRLTCSIVFLKDRSLN